MHPWHIDRLDLEAYLARVGASAQPASVSALSALLEAHVRTFTFDNIDVLLGQHPGVALEAVERKFVGRGRGGYCFEHATLFSAALERLGYVVERRLGRVGDPHNAARTHLVVIVTLDGRRLFCDPGFGVSTLRPLELTDGAESDYCGIGLRLRRVGEGAGHAWELHRLGLNGWDLMHTHDELPVRPIDVVHGHHLTSTYSNSVFLQMLMVAGWAGDRHITLTERTVTIRQAGQPSEHREIGLDEFQTTLGELGVPLTAAERERLVAAVTTLRERA